MFVPMTERAKNASSAPIFELCGSGANRRFFFLHMNIIVHITTNDALNDMHKMKAKINI